MVMMSIDYGDVRTGFALCDKSETLAFPLCVVNEKDPVALSEKATLLAEENQAELIVVGYPKNMDGSEGFKAQSVNEFARLLKEASNLPVELWDERLTTVAAHRILSENNVRGKKRKNTVDAVAAVLILQDYIKYRKIEGGSSQ